MKSLKFGPAIILASAVSIILGLISISSAAELSANRRAVASATPTPAPPTLQMSLVYPTNGVLNSGGSETIQASITVGPPPSISIQKYRVVVAVRDAKGHIVRHHAFHPVSNQSMANLDMKSVPAGSYNVSADVYHRGRRLTGSNSYGVTKEGPTPTPIDSATPTPAPTTTPRPTPTPAPTPTAKPTKTPTPKRTRTATPTPKSTKTPTPTPTATGSSAGVWNLEPTANGFQWAAPSGGAVCKFASVSGVDNTQLTRAGQDVNVVPDKYATWPAWAQAQSDRLKSWGFNAAGQYSYAYSTSANFPSGGVPVEGVVQVSGHATRDDGTYYHCKSLNWNYGASMACGSSFYNEKGNGGGNADVFDTSCDSGGGYAGAVMADTGTGGASNLFCPWCSGQQNTELIITEEADNLYGLNHTSHEDFGYDIAAQSPMQTVSPTGYIYPNATVDAKIALRDWLAYTYGCVNPAGGGIGTPISGGDDIYPSAAYCGSTNAARALTSVNAAWSTSYTTWSTSDAKGEAGIKAGSYNSYGAGTGMLDENGTHLMSSAYQSYCNLNGGPNPLNNWASHAQIETDLHGFVAYFAQTYAQKLSAGWAQASENPHPPIFVPLYDAPDYVYKAMAPYFDGFWISPNAGTSLMSVTDLQRIIADASVTGGKSMPIIVADYYSANPDSPYSAYPGSAFTTQAARGTAMASWWASAIHQQDANGKYVVVGLEHWGFYDQANENTNFGLVTTDHDNPYDGSADTANGEAANYGDAITPLSDFLNGGICDP